MKTLKSSAAPKRITTVPDIICRRFYHDAVHEFFPCKAHRSKSSSRDWKIGCFTESVDSGWFKVGLRPEHILVGSTAGSEDTLVVWSSPIEMYEVLGGEIPLYAKIRDSPVRGRVPAVGNHGKEECEVLVAFHREYTYIFDAETGRGGSLGRNPPTAH